MSIFEGNLFDFYLFLLGTNQAGITSCRSVVWKTSIMAVRALHTSFSTLRPSAAVVRRASVLSSLKRQRRFFGAQVESAAPDDDFLIDVSDLAFKMRQEVRDYSLQHATSPVRLAGVMAHSGPPKEDAEIYSEKIRETFAEDGIDYEVCRCPGDKPEDVEQTIRMLNERDDVNGILVFYPIFKREHNQSKPRGPYLNRLTGVHYKTNDDYLRDVVIPEKDVEGLCHDYNARWLFRARGMNRTDQEAYVPCTALSVMKILEEFHPNLNLQQLADDHKRWAGCTVTVVNRSEILGRPLAALLALEGASVYSVDENSILLFQPGGKMRRCADLTLKECLRRSSIVVTGVPSSQFLLPSCAVAPGSTVVNVATNHSNIIEASLRLRPNVKYVPFVGKVTVAALEQNLIRLHQEQMKKKMKD